MVAILGASPTPTWNSVKECNLFYVSKHLHDNNHMWQTLATGGIGMWVVTKESSLECLRPTQNIQRLEVHTTYIVHPELIKLKALGVRLAIFHMAW